MLQSELTANWEAVVLTWCYDLDPDVRFALTDVCTWTVVGGDIFLASWLLSSPFTAPTQGDLLAMNLTTCQDTYHNAYTERDEIKTFQDALYHATTTHLADALLTPDDEGWLAFDTTLKKVVRYVPGTGWTGLW